ncbi:hypothetical protein O181_032364 [Austropuccinia psidii MF-1]|uniref:Uncharacterized protein n=1 Tax=Austropuccinia psidii MF-1 TaxID=1389203 RepID=A0A9Q3CXA5_9BASI|nr:hypothetical protein [Austropuccinia psidii MF-1]
MSQNLEDGGNLWCVDQHNEWELSAPRNTSRQEWSSIAPTNATSSPLDSRVQLTDFSANQLPRTPLMQEWTPIPPINATRSPLDVHVQLTNGSVNCLRSSTKSNRLCMPRLHHFSVSHSPMPDPRHETMILPKNLLNGHGCNTSPLISSSGNNSSLHADRSQDYSRPQVLMNPSPQNLFNLHYGYEVNHVYCMS